MAVSALSIDKAIKLYRLLEFHLPEEVGNDETIVEFIGKIVRDMQIKGQHHVYIQALALMQNTDMQTIMDTYTPMESVSQFAIGLQENQILALKEFCEKVGF